MSTEDLKALGSGSTRYTFDHPDSSLLEWFDNPHVNEDGAMEIVITAPEFTSLCPKTGQPDFATIVIKYVPDEYCVESKSLKLYLMSFRNHGEFHEACVSRIAGDLINLLDPIRLEVEGQFTPRGGISFWPSVRYVCDAFVESNFELP